MNITIHLVNDTDADLFSGEPNWTVFTICQVILIALSILTNGGVLALFLRNPYAITSFHLYFVYLLTGNLVYSLYVGPLDVMHNLHHTWPLGSRACTAHIYGMNLVQGYVECVHLTIAINRLWALYYPVHYRRHHTRKVAFCIGLTTVAYPHLWILPLVIIDVLYYRQTPEEVYGCSAHVVGQWSYQAALQFGFFNSAIVFIVCAYPALIYKHLLWRKSRVAAEERTSMSVPTDDRKRRTGRHETNSTAFTVLTLLTGTVCLCWVPNVAFFTFLLFADGTFPTFYMVVRTLYYLQSVMDPIYFVCTMRDLRNQLRMVLRL